MERRLEGMNEFRDALKDQSAKFITREEMGLIVDPVRSDIAALREEVAQHRGRTAGLTASWRWLIGAAGALAAVATVISIVTALIAG